MREQLVLVVAVVMMVAGSCSQKEPGNLVLVEGGTFLNTKSGYYGKNITLPGFYIGKYEVTQKEWVEVTGHNPSKFTGENLPVEMVSWYDCVDYCNKRSIKEGLSPYYTIAQHTIDTGNTNSFDDVKWTVAINEKSNGYRLPTEAEWEYAAGGGNISKNSIYSGSNDVDEVAWYWKNSGDQYLTGVWLWPTLEKNNNKTKPAGSKKANELGLYDMSGNVREWCWDGHKGNGNEDLQGRVWKGGGWIGADFCCEPSFHGSHQANGIGPDQGFRVCRGSELP